MLKPSGCRLPPHAQSLPRPIEPTKRPISISAGHAITVRCHPTGPPPIPYEICLDEIDALTVAFIFSRIRDLPIMAVTISE
jgi:hypothetical protein